MSIPNKTTKFEWCKQILFECDCKNNHFLELTSDRDNEWKDDNLTLLFIDQPVPLWTSIKNWFRHGRSYFSDIILPIDDCKELVKYLNEHIEFVEDRDAELKKNKKRLNDNTKEN